MVNFENLEKLQAGSEKNLRNQGKRKNTPGVSENMESLNDIPRILERFDIYIHI